MKHLTKKNVLLAVFLCLWLSQGYAQTLTDISIGSSKQDRVLVNLAYRKQFSDNFRAGLELQSGLVNYRFIGAKVIDEGVSTTISLPILLRLYQRDNLRLDLYTRAGLRFYGVSSEYQQEEALQANSSMGFGLEPGLAVTFFLSERVSFQSGVTLPVFFESSPEFLYENNTTYLFANLGYQLSERSVLLLKAGSGPAAGANGDSQKYVWSLQAGVRFSFGSQGNRAAMILEPSF